jgi:hypothetical protein
MLITIKNAPASYEGLFSGMVYPKGLAKNSTCLSEYRLVSNYDCLRNCLKLICIFVCFLAGITKALSNTNCHFEVATPCLKKP